MVDVLPMLMAVTLVDGLQTTMRIDSYIDYSQMWIIELPYRLAVALMYG
jgi:hypothetical protein